MYKSTHFKLIVKSDFVNKIRLQSKMIRTEAFKFL